MIPDLYGWLFLDALLVPAWLWLFLRFPTCRRPMLWISLLTVPYAIAEIVYIPKYWNPPSILEARFFLIHKHVRLELEAFLFCFLIGGLAAAFYPAFLETWNRFRNIRGTATADQTPKHHAGIRWAVGLSPYLLCPFLYYLVTHRNITYAGILALGLGALWRLALHPGQWRRCFGGAALFLVYYTLAEGIFELVVPGYFLRVWNMARMSGVILMGIPVEELYWAAAYGLYASGLYEWLRPAPEVQHR